ncbi:RNA polymerase sigma factor [Pedobacter nutrimenti]|uniref:RNA polymerase sigma-70 factor (ECF subfamily) n=1 Tax=Pedobacter nutrimenti TaxID=1241337 RepID=A0A318UKW1_9SPHI|nr:sigma-70 family RNA polymerase sigma factor [Pedobacter nutrimenti]PYF76130.1 RNA polymerase sigma-70 factor (ECF subfamily) [Pedobacter nutrimenti]
MSGYKSLSDPDLISMIKDGDHAAYTEIYERYHYLVFIEAYRKLGDEELAKDIVQELFVNLWIKRQKTTDVENLAGYLLTAVKFRIFDFFDHQNVESKYIASLKDYTNTGNIAHTDYLTREREWEKYIDLAIQSLPQKMRQIFQLNKSDNLSYKEIAKKLNTTENNVQKHINGAIKVLKTKLTALF